MGATDKWYYSLDGRAQGPVETEVILEGLRTGRFTLVDLIFPESGVQWITIGEIPEFQRAFVTLTARLPNLPEFTQAQERPWVLLRKSDKSEQPYEQSGPYSAAEICARLGRGDIQYVDYVWKPGFQRWVRIGNLPEFDRRRSRHEVDPEVYSVPLPQDQMAKVIAMRPVSRDEAFARVETVQPATLQKETKPPEASGADLTEAAEMETAEPPIALPRGRSLLQESEDTPLRSWRDTFRRPPPSGFKKTSVRWWSGAAIGCLVTLLLLIFWQSPQEDPQGIDHSSVLPMAEPLKEDEPSPEEIKEEARAGEPPIEEDKQIELVEEEGLAEIKDVEDKPSVALDFIIEDISVDEDWMEIGGDPERSTAGQLKLDVDIQTADSGPVFRVRTSAQAQQKVYLLVRAKTGDVLSYPSYQRLLSQKKSAQDVLVFNLQPLKLPAGSYEAQVRVGGNVKSKKFKHTAGLKNWNADLQRHKKKIAFQQQTEKKALFYSLKKTEALGQEFTSKAREYAHQAGAMKRYYSSWRGDLLRAEGLLRDMKGRNPNKYAFPDEIRQARQLYKKLREQAEAVKSSVGKERGVASQSLPVLKDITRLKSQVARLK